MKMFDEEFNEILKKQIKKTIEKKQGVRTSLIDRLETLIFHWAMDREAYRNLRLKDGLPILEEGERKFLENKMLSLNEEEAKILVSALRTEDVLAVLEAKERDRREVKESER